MAVESPGIDGLVVGGEAGRHESHLSVLADDGIAQEGFMLRYVDGSSGLEFMPAVRACHQFEEIVSR
ncbi:MAG: hypothetical protein CMJ24_11020 [Phycisphaerae bacterium]|nr:hypothetical protein [Phycisphaerae bacterium]